jgi:hypothetical protein
LEALSKPKVRLSLVLFCGLASARVYFLFKRLVPQVGSAEPTSAHSLFPWVKPLTHEALQAVQKSTDNFWYTGKFVACCAALFLLYALMVWAARGMRSRWFPGIALGLSALLMAVLICAPAMLSSDTYAYAYYGRLLTVYHVDAHAPVPAGSLHDPFLAGGWYDFVPSVYGPLWTILSGGLALAGGGHVGLTLFLFRLLQAISVLGTGAFIWLILKRIAPEQAPLGAALFLWNPLVLMECALGGHNDNCMMLLAVLAVWLHLRGSKIGAVLALTLSALIKVITGPLAPLYMLMIARNCASWRERALFAGRACLAAGLALALSMIGARMSPNGLLVHTASSAQFFENNYHELLFKGLRRLLGEHADSIEAPMDFRTYWVAVCGSRGLREGVSKDTNELCRLKPNQPLLVISDEDSDNWLRVYDPARKMQGYVDWPHLTVIPDPPIATTDPVAQRLSGWPPDWPTVSEANRILRVATWSLFIAFGLLAAWKTTDFDKFLLWGTAFLLAAQLLVFTKIWPWYAVWPLAFGAFKPKSGGMRLALMLSAGMSIMYVLFDFSASERWRWVNDCRSLPCIVLPVLLFAATQFWPRSERSGTVLLPSLQPE